MTRPIHRRTVLKIAGGAALAAVGGATWRAYRAGLIDADEAPYELWDQWSSGKLDGPRWLVAAAVLAANPHDSQPWWFHIAASSIDVHLDLSRALGPVDPLLRQMHLGAGCAIENLVVAGRGRGLGVAIESPAGAPTTLVARAHVAGTVATEHRHFEALARRHTNRGPYRRDQALTTAAIDALHAQVSDAATRLLLFHAGSAEGRAFSDAVVWATRRLVVDEPFMEATDRWFRMTPREVALHRDGPSLATSGLGRVAQWAAAIGPRPNATTSHDTWVSATIDRHVATAPMFGAICVRDRGSREQRVAAGRLWQRLHLEATAAGLGAQPLDQLLELADRELELAAGRDADHRVVALGAPGWTPVLMFRVGLPIDVAPPSARRDLQSFLA